MCNQVGTCSINLVDMKKPRSTMANPSYFHYNKLIATAIRPEKSNHAFEVFKTIILSIQ